MIRMRRRTTSDALAALVALASFAGCTTVYEGKYDWDEGWRVGRVVNLGVGTALAPTPPDDCRQEATPAEVARTLYAEVAYRSEGRWLRHRVAPVPQGMTLTDGQRVYVNLHSCGDGLVKASGGS